MVVCDTDLYDERYSKKVIRKNVSIPAYLNTYGELHNINFSKVLKDALMKIACFWLFIEDKKINIWKKDYLVL